MIKMPAVFLSFDDCHIREWHATLPLLEENGIKATFYLSNISDIDNTGWKALQKIRDADHVIAYHGLNHLRAGASVIRDGCEAYLKYEIYPGLEILDKKGFRNIRHFSYPRGNRTRESNICLFEIFDTLRIGGRELYTTASMANARLIKSLNFGKFPERKMCGHEGLLALAGRTGKAVFFYMHEPVAHRLQYMGEFAKQNGLNFHTMEELNK